MSCEAPTEGGEDSQDALKAFSLGLLSGADQEGMQLDELLQQFSGILHRADLRRVELYDTTRSITGDEGITPNANDTQERLLERYLPDGGASSRDDHTQDTRGSLTESTAQLLCDIQLSAPTFSWNNLQETVEDENDDQIAENLSKLSVSSKATRHLPTEYLKPICRKELGEQASSTIKSLRGQWATGSDLSSYTWPGLSNYRDASPDPVGMTASAAMPRSQPAPGTMSSLSMPGILAPSTQMPFRPPNSAGASLPTLKHQSQVHFEVETQSQTQDFASTQLVQGPFGNRNPLSFRRSLGKKRTIGF